MSNLKLEVGKTYINEAGTDVKIVNSIQLIDGSQLYLSSTDTFYYENGAYYDSWLESGHIVDIKSDDSFVRLASIEAKAGLSAYNKSAAAAFEILRVWGEKVFGPVEPSRIVERAQEEMDELRLAVEHGWTEKALEEAADVVGVLTRAPGLWDAIIRKMNINFERKWNIKGDGTGYHVSHAPELNTANTYTAHHERDMSA